MSSVMTAQHYWLLVWICLVSLDPKQQQFYFCQWNQRRQVDETNEKNVELVQRYGKAISEGTMNRIEKAVRLKLVNLHMEIKARSSSDSPSAQDLLDRNFSDADEEISETEEAVLGYNEIFKLLSIPIPQFLKDSFNEIIHNKKIPVSSYGENSDADFKIFFVYTENTVLREICDLLTSRDIIRIYQHIKDNSPSEYLADVRNKKIEEDSMMKVVGLKETAFYYLIFQMIQAKLLNRLYTHNLEYYIKVLIKKDEAEGHPDIRRFQESLDKLKRYPVSSHPPGICIIFSMERNRPGAENDRLAVKDLFEKTYKYGVVLRVDPRKSDVETVISKLRSSKNKFYDSLVVWFMGHGKHDSLHVEDGEIKRRKDFIEPFTEIRWFNKKPKLFFIQACAVEDPSESELQNRRSGSSLALEANTDAYSFGQQTSHVWNNRYGNYVDFTSVNNYADTLIANATTWCQQAARSQEGSLYVQTVIDLLKRFGHKESIENVLRKVHYNVNTVALETKETEWKQSPFYECCLQKEFIFPNGDK